MRLLKFIIAGLAISGATAASAGQCGYEYCWGAVGIGPNGAWGYAHSQYSESDAVNAVQDACEGDCDVIESFYNTCGAMSEGTEGNWGFGWADSRELAESTSLEYCDDYGGGCRVRVWACSF